MSNSDVTRLYLRHGSLAKFNATFGSEPTQLLLKSGRFHRLLLDAGPAELVVGDPQELNDYYWRYRPGVSPPHFVLSGLDHRVSQQPLLLLNSDHLREKPVLAANHYALRLWDAVCVRHQRHARDFKLACEHSVMRPEDSVRIAQSLVSLMQGRSCLLMLSLGDEIGLEFNSLYTAAIQHRTVRDALQERVSEVELASAIGDSVIAYEPDAQGRGWNEVFNLFELELESLGQAQRVANAVERRQAFELVH